MLLGCSGHLDTHCAGPSMVSSGDARSKGMSGDPQQAESEMHLHWDAETKQAEGPSGTVLWDWRCEAPPAMVLAHPALSSPGRGEELSEAFRLALSPSKAPCLLHGSELKGRAGGSPSPEPFQSPGGCDQGAARPCTARRPAPYSHRWSFGISGNGRCSPGVLGKLQFRVTINKSPIRPLSAPATLTTCRLGCSAGTWLPAARPGPRAGCGREFGISGVATKRGSIGGCEGTAGSSPNPARSPGCTSC